MPGKAGGTAKPLKKPKTDKGEADSVTKFDSLILLIPFC